MSSITNERLDSLLETVQQLYPSSRVRVVRKLSAEQQGLRLVPSLSNPRLAVPATVPSAAMWSAIRPCASDTAGNKVRRYGLAAILRSPLLPWLMPSGIVIDAAPDSILEVFETVFGREVCFGLMTGTARANRKPVLGVFDSSGKELGFAKVGFSELAKDLVENEYHALQAMNKVRHPEIQVPRVLNLTRWKDTPVLVMSALRPDAWQQAIDLPVATVRAIIASAPVRSERINQSQWFYTLVTTLQELPSEAEAAPLIDLLRAMAVRFTHVEVATGAWHGDFGAWNMARTTGAPMVWDWERYSQDIPLGLDLFHFSSHESLRRIGDFESANTALTNPHLARAVQSLHRQHTDSSESNDLAQLLPLMYLATMAARFITDGFRHSVRDTLALGQWHVAVLKELYSKR